ncbi:MAG: cation-translocating P-type ATPase, partial [Defluviitaleaceae bacterium]|nr:cation-translocating P-type ATPase [Defluviitaleaceae bacterium]
AAEAALAEYALTLGQNRSHLEPLFARLYTLPADNGRMRMTTVHLNDGRVMQFTKGAPEQVLALCTHILTDGEEFELTDEDAENLLTRIQLMAGQGKSVLAAAFKEYAYEFPEEIEAALESGADALECDMTFIGIAGMTNAVRPEAAAAIAACKAAGITPVMITGEHKDTAVAIARQLELVSDASQAMTGGEISAIDRLEYEERLESIGVYARVAPGGKAGIVGAWRRKGYVCAVTGIGVHDAPSLQSADIGIGLGANSADAVNNNAGIVLADTGFENVVAAVGEGRRIYDNVRRTALFLLTSNLAQVLAVFLATVFGFVILRPGHLLWISLVPGAVVAAALALEQAEAGIMNRPPRNPGESFFAGGAGTAVLWHGVAGAVPAFAAYIAGSFFEHGLVSFDRSVTGITMAFLTFSVYQCLLALNIGGKRGSMAAVLQHNKHLRTAVAASLILALLLIYAPGVNGFAGFVPLMPAGLAVSIVLGALVVPVSSVLRTRV